MTMSFDKRLEELSAKMMEGIKKNHEWFQKEAAVKRGGAPMPYDERLGVSREEYEEYLQLIKQGQAAKLVERTVLEFENIENADGSHSLDVGLPYLRGIKFDSKRNLIETPYGILKGPKEQDAKGGVFGPWKGLVYELIEGTPESVAQTGAKSVSLTLGRQRETGRRFLMYKGLVVENGVRTATFEIILMFE